MAYESGSATGVQDLMAKLSIFAQAQGWTEDHEASDRLLIHKGSALYPSFRWATSSPAEIAVYHALGFVNSGTDPGNHTNDSGQGVISGTGSTILTGRHVPLVNGAMTYFFFSGSGHLHVVVRVAAGDYRCFGMGSLDKHGNNYTGGEYVFGWRWNFASSDFDLLAVRTDSAMLLDGIGTEVAFAASVHMEGIPNQAAGKWGVVGNISAPGVDRGSTARSKVLGGFRCGLGRHFGWSNQQDVGLANTYSIPCFALTNSDADLYLLGVMPEIRGIDLLAYAPEQEINMGGQVWMAFPSKQRGVYDGASKHTSYQGIAFRKS